MTTRKPMLILLTSALLLVGTACGGGGGDVAGGGGGSSNLSASFVADQPTPGSNTVSIAQGSASGNMVTLQVNVTDTSDVHTAAFDIVFDDSAVDYVGYSGGTLLEQGGNTPLYQIGQGPGRIVVGVSRSGSSGADAVGSQELVDFNFRVTRAGQFQVSIVNATLRDASLTDISGVAWFGGSLMAN